MSEQSDGTLTHLLSCQRVQYGEVAHVGKGEDDHFACVVIPRSSCHIQLAVMRRHNRGHHVT